MAGEFWFELTFILLLIVANGFFSDAEIAIVSVRRSCIDQLLEEGSTAAQVVGRLKDDSDCFLVTVQSARITPVWLCHVRSDVKRCREEETRFEGRTS